MEDITTRVGPAATDPLPMAPSARLTSRSPVEGLAITERARATLADAGIRDVGRLVEALDDVLRYLDLGDGGADLVRSALALGSREVPVEVGDEALRALCLSSNSREFTFDGLGALLRVPPERRPDGLRPEGVPVADAGVGELGLTVPILRALEAHGIGTAGRLAKLSDGELAGLRGLGGRRVRRIREGVSRVACELISGRWDDPPRSRPTSVEGVCDAALAGTVAALDECVARSYPVCGRTFVAAFAFGAEGALGVGMPEECYRGHVLALVESSDEVRAACMAELASWRDACRTRPREEGVEESRALPGGAVWERAALSLCAADAHCSYDGATRTVTLGRLTLDEWLDGWLARAVPGAGRDVVDAYLDLGSAQACAEACGIPRVQARVLVDRALRHAPALAEDRFRHLLEAYRPSRGDFLALTGEGVRTFSYLRATRTRGRLPPVRPLEEAISDPGVPEEVREAVARRLGRAFVEVGDLLVARTRGEVVRHVARTCASDAAVTMGELWDAYQAFLAEHGLARDGEFWFCDVDSLDRFVTRNCPDVMRVSRAADGRCGGSVRYYDPQGRDFAALVSAIEGAGYGDLACSSALLMRDPRLREAIESLDIRNEYELHHVLAHHCGPIEGLRVSKSPSLVFGEGDHEAQARALVAEVGPVTGPELSRAYEGRYGMRAGSVSANVLPLIRDWCEGGTYRVPGDRS